MIQLCRVTRGNRQFAKSRLRDVSTWDLHIILLRPHVKSAPPRHVNADFANCLLTLLNVKDRANYKSFLKTPYIIPLNTTNGFMPA